MRRLVALGVAGVLAAGLAGCSPLGFTHGPPSPKTSSVTATTSHDVVTIPDGVVATGRILSTDNSTRGSLTVTKQGSNFTFVVTHFSTPYRGELIFGLADTPLHQTDCAADGRYQIGLTTPSGTAQTSFSIVLPDDNGDWSDPSFFETFAVVQYPTGSAAACSEPILGVATIDWHVPNTHPHLSIVDSGARTSALGSVTSRGGSPFTYRTHQGDTWSAIAARFGISGADLEWLNPVRPSQYKNETAYADEVLNLEVNNRGDSLARRLESQAP